MLNSYILTREIGKGGFGSVYMAVRRSDEIRVAIKILHLPDDENRRRFHREAMVLHRHLSNRHIVDLLDWDFDCPNPHIVMELCEGSLRAWVGRRTEWRDVCTAICHAAEGLQGIHTAGGFHRDIKPDNLLITRTPLGQVIVKVGDFGLARIPDLSSGPMTRSPWGTEGYIAPELLEGVPFDQRCDIFSLGVTGIELLTGSRSPASLSARLDVPVRVRRTLEAMIAVNPGTRPSLDACLREFVAALSEIVEPQPVKKPAASYVAPAEQQGGGGGLVALLGVAVAGIFALATMNSKDRNGRFHGKDGRFSSGRW